jgi:hypothetical protein
MRAFCLVGFNTERDVTEQTILLRYRFEHPNELGEEFTIFEMDLLRLLWLRHNQSSSSKSD